MEWFAYLIALFFALIVVLLIGMPVGFGLALLGVGIYSFMVGPLALSNVASHALSASTSWVLTTLPMFVLMAEVMIATGLGSGIFDLAKKLLKWLPGGLAIATIWACGVFAAACGTSTATALAVGKMSINEMMARGYDKRLSVGATASGGTLGILIPPSITMIFYCALTEQSLGHLFIAGFIPGLMAVILFSLYIALRVKIKPDTISSSNIDADIAIGKIPVKEVVSLLVIIGTVFAALYAGIATPTEVGALGAGGSIVVALIFKRLTKENLLGALVSTTRLTAFVIFIVIGANLFASATSYIGLTESMVNYVIGLNFHPRLMLVLIYIMHLILGMFLDPAAMMCLTLPFIFPLILKLGYDPIWFGIVLVILCEAGYLTPPFGFNLFVVKGISPPEVSMEDIIMGSMPFLVMLMTLVAILTAFPEIVLWLPSTMQGS